MGKYRHFTYPADSFRVGDDGIVRQLVYTNTIEGEMGWVATWLRPGARCSIGSRLGGSPNVIRDGWDRDEFFMVHGDAGIRGNSNPKIRRTSGWRGTTDNVSVYANGTGTIVSSRELKNGRVSVRVRID